MKFCKLMSYDLHRGLQWKKYLIAVLIFALRIYTEYRSVQFYCKTESLPSQGSIGDYMLCIFRGMAITQYGSIEEKVLIPIEWLILCGFCIYLTAAYSSQDISVQGQQVFLRTSRGKWWLSKCIWCIASCAIYFVCEMIALVSVVFFTPISLHLNNTPEITAFLFSEVLWGDTILLMPTRVILHAVILPFISLTALSLMQTCLNLVMRPSVSFLICFTVLIASAYFPRGWLLGNGVMVMRSQLFDANGFAAGEELIAASLLISLSVGIGYVLIQKKDFISLEK